LKLAKTEEKETNGKATGAKKSKLVSLKTLALYIKLVKNITKFKLRSKKYLYTFKTDDKDKAKKLQESLPASLTKVEIKSKKLAAKKK
jgi:large subunit ribosomal protein L38e